MGKSGPWMALVMVLGFGLAPGLGQPPPEVAPPAAGPPTPGDRPADVEAARRAMRDRLAGRLAEAQRTIERLQLAIKRLDEGATAEQVASETGERLGRPGGREGPTGRDGGEGPGAGGPRRPGPDEARAAAPAEPVTLERFLKFLDEHRPELGVMVRESAQRDERFAKRFVERNPMVRLLLEERSPEMRELRLAELDNGLRTFGAMRELGEAMKADPADAARVEKAKAGLAERFAAEFDIRRQMHEHELASLKAEVTRLQGELDEQASRRDSMIAERLERTIRFIREGPRRGRGEPGRAEPGRAGGDGRGG